LTQAKIFIPSRANMGKAEYGVSFAKLLRRWYFNVSILSRRKYNSALPFFTIPKVGFVCLHKATGDGSNATCGGTPLY